MFKNCLRIAMRNLRKYKGYSFINILGLSLGMACFLLILSYVQNELSFERFHENRDRLFRLMRVERMEGEFNEVDYVPAPLAPAVQDQFPEIIAAIRITRGGGVTVQYRDKTFVERRILMADSPFFKAFSFPLRRGNAETVLEEQYSVVVTEDMAFKYFGNEDPIGKTMTYANRIDLTVTGIMENPPVNTDFQFDFIIPFTLINEIHGYNYLDSWGAFNFQIFVLTQENPSVLEFREKSLEFCQSYRTHDPPEYRYLYSLFLQPITELHLALKSVTTIVIFSVIAVFILLLACINFMNLAVAQSAAREKEVGLRKVIGAGRRQLIQQFLGESVVLAMISLPLAVILVEVIRPMYNRLLNINLHVDYAENWPYTLMLFGIAIVVGLISGVYPAFYATAKRPIEILQGLWGRGAKRSMIRTLLVIFQFSISVMLIIGTLIIQNQLHYIRTKNLGFQKDHVINVILYDRELRRNVENIKAELLKYPQIVSASGNYFMSGGGNNSIDWEGREDGEERLMRFFSVDADFLETFRIELIEGRNFRKRSETDLKQAYLLNESAVQELGWESAVGKNFEVQMAGSEMGNVIGVVKDFHFQSLRQAIRPLAIKMTETPGIVSVRIIPENIPETIDCLERTVRKFAPNAPFEYYFLDSDIDDMYSYETTMGKIFSHFSMLAIVIACMGLLGLTSYTIVWRTKEIGVRKVLGASTSTIIALLTKAFAAKVLIANAVAWPIAYLAMNRWLQYYAYRESIKIWIFLFAMGLAFVISIITVSYQVVRAARKNPVSSLRYE